MSSSGVSVKCDWCDTIGTVPDGEWGIHCTRCGRLLLIPLGRRDRYIGIGDIPEILISRVDKKVVLMKYEGHEYIIGNYTIALINGQTVCGTLRVYHSTQRIVDDYRKTRRRLKEAKADIHQKAQVVEDAQKTNCELRKECEELKERNRRLAEALEKYIGKDPLINVLSCSAVANNDEPCSSTQNQNNEDPEPERKKRRSSADSDEL